MIKTVALPQLMLKQFDVNILLIIYMTHGVIYIQEIAQYHNYYTA